ncbi:MAG: AAA family ATPase, partial [Gammaproteobacteria bacterium]|nr:AAA family ATPase [Gammaproteobacteria bacterium]
MANRKGGVGKTTTSVNLSASLSLSGHKTLLLDLDPQGNATTGSGVDKTELATSMHDWLMDDASLEEVRKPCPGGFDLVPCNSDLTAAEVALLAVDGREAQLRRRLDAAPAVQRYRYLIMDCPPSLNILTLNALVAADSVLIPIQCEYYS